MELQYTMSTYQSPFRFVQVIASPMNPPKENLTSSHVYSSAFALRRPTNTTPEKASDDGQYPSISRFWCQSVLYWKLNREVKDKKSNSKTEWLRDSLVDEITKLNTEQNRREPLLGVVCCHRRKVEELKKMMHSAESRGTDKNKRHSFFLKSILNEKEEDPETQVDPDRVFSVVEKKRVRNVTFSWDTTDPTYHSSKNKPKSDRKIKEKKKQRATDGPFPSPTPPTPLPDHTPRHRHGHRLLKDSGVRDPQIGTMHVVSAGSMLTGTGTDLDPSSQRPAIIPPRDDDLPRVSGIPPTPETPSEAVGAAPEGPKDNVNSPLLPDRPQESKKFVSPTKLLYRLI